MQSIAEVWKDIQGYECLYQVSNLGRVKSLRRSKIRKLCKDRGGYLCVSLKKHGTVKLCKVHRLVAIAFIPNPENKPQVDHINRIRNDNRVCNLRWVTNTENQYNSSNARLLNYKGRLAPLTILCNEKDIKTSTVIRRLKSGWSVEDALDKPVDTRFYKKSQGGIKA